MRAHQVRSDQVYASRAERRALHTGGQAIGTDTTRSSVSLELLSNRKRASGSGSLTRKLTEDGVVVSPMCEDWPLAESLPQGRRAGRAQCVETPCSGSHGKRHHSGWTPADAHTHTQPLTSDTHAQCSHKHVSHERLHMSVCASLLMFVLYLPDHRPCRRITARGSSGRAGRAQCVETPYSARYTKGTPQVDTSKHTHTPSHSLSLSLSYSLTFSYFLLLSLTLFHSLSLSYSLSLSLSLSLSFNASSF